MQNKTLGCYYHVITDINEGQNMVRSLKKCPNLQFRKGIWKSKQRESEAYRIGRPSDLHGKTQMGIYCRYRI